MAKDKSEKDKEERKINATNIEWVKNPDGTQGYTWNPITGCLNHTYEGLCKGGGFPCYAWRLAHGRLKQRYLANRNIAPLEDDLAFRVRFKDGSTALDDPFYPRFWPERLLDVPFTKKPLGIFTVDMGELFGDWIPDWWIEKVFKTISMHPEHRFYLLTKQPQNLAKFSPFPANCFVGVTATNDFLMQEAIIHLANISARVRFISLEPLLNRISYIDAYSSLAGAIDWVIIGAQTKPAVYPKIEWVEEIVRACDKAGVKVFLKDNLRSLLVDALTRKLIDRKQFFVHSTGYGGDLRQEMP